MLKITRLEFFKFSLLLIADSLFSIPGNKPGRAGKYAPTEKEPGTLENLLTAYNRESNTYNLYQAFSEKAEKEGFPRAALLFRAVLRSTKVQMENHAEAIKKMNGTPKSDAKPPVVKTTAENLQTVIQEESDKYNNLYPSFLKKARKERDRIALRTFNFAKSAAAANLKFFKDASSDPEAWEKKERTFWVCTICGNTVTALNFDECPICFNPLEKYVQIK